MGSPEIATALRTTAAEQRSCCVPTVDNTDVSPRERFEAHVDALPCTSAIAGWAVEAHGSSTSIGANARGVGVVPATMAKFLYRCGEAGVISFASEARHIVRDWIDGHISRTDVLALTGAEPSEFALVTYIETRDPIDPLVEAVGGVLADHTGAVIAKHNPLVETMSSATDMQL